MSSLQDLTPGTWNIDPAHTEIAFTARHLMVTKVRGRFTEYEGSVTIGEQLEDSKVSVMVQLASVDTRHPDRDAHLRSPDFFNVEKYPTMTFESTSIGQGALTGDLTINGQTHPITFDVEFNGVTGDPWGGTRAGFEATTRINRKDWGLTWNAAIESGGVVVSDAITISVDLELVKAAEAGQTESGSAQTDDAAQAATS